MNLGQITAIVTVFVALIVVSVVAGGAWYLYYIKIYLPNHPEREKKQVQINYSEVHIEDATEYAKFDDIADFGDFGAIVTENYTTFTAMLEMTGYDYDMASYDEKVSTIHGAVAATNVITDHLQIRQNAKDRDLSNYIQAELDIIELLEEKIRILAAEAEELNQRVAPLMTEETMDPERVSVLEHYLEQLEFNLKEQKKNQFLIRDEKANIAALTRNSGKKVDPERHSFYIFNWTYRPMQYRSKPLKGKEIYEEAERQLKNKAAIYRNAMAGANVQSKLMEADQILMELYDHNHPLTRGRVKLEDLLNSTYFHLYTTVSDETKALLQEKERVV